MEAVIECVDISKRFDQVLANDHLNLRLEQGKILGLIGVNGSGKSTLLNQIAGFLPVDQGLIRLLGEQLKPHHASMRSHLGYAGIDICMPALSAIEILEHKMQLTGNGSQTEIFELLDFFGLPFERNKPYRKYSLGMQQKLRLCLAFLGHPEVLVFDEPLNALDPIAIRRFRELVLYRRQNDHASFLISSHIISELYQVCDSFCIIHQGRNLQDIERSQLDELCRDYYCLDTDNNRRAFALLETLLKIPNLQLNSRGEIIFPQQNFDSRQLMRILLDADLGIKSLRIEAITFDAYYASLLNVETDLFNPSKGGQIYQELSMRDRFTNAMHQTTLPVFDVSLRPEHLATPTKRPMVDSSEERPRRSEPLRDLRKGEESPTDTKPANSAAGVTAEATKTEPRKKTRIFADLEKSYRAKTEKYYD
ncbi:MAG: ABC transporter ATP-binding protein [Eubacteriales bacterium]|nr:ABC transporter ATP-binding protein [Eubacteriales bacterium]